ncbi:hypothetical protein L1987_13028 [Smallanthus sonchifolius]|uniref:Uncharacterized protein n=1 Tax=Smallanthus sonchifolius TaxID=185202 RepID=A0ACB9JFC9_9ASTR|nr:hypothetical protein L1987_13028 [Smallanthus sonchifolius]
MLVAFSSIVSDIPHRLLSGGSPCLGLVGTNVRGLDGDIALGLSPASVNAAGSDDGNLESSNDGSGGTLNMDSSTKKQRGRFWEAIGCFRLGQ